MAHTNPTQQDTKHGIVIGHFAPLTLAQCRHINALLGQVDKLHLVVLPPHHTTDPTAQDCARWLQVSFAGIDFVKIHTLDSLGLVNGDTASVCQALQLDNPRIFDPIKSSKAVFDELAQACRYFYGTSIAIVGGESSGKTTLIHKLANHYNASVALEMGRLYANSHLGGSEVGLQYSDYGVIANSHAQAIYTAKNQGRLLTLIDTDFITTQVFCEVYEHKTHPLVNAYIDESYDPANPYRIDHTIYLDNNVKWVADGTRRLGNARSEFAQKLLDKYTIHHIKLSVIDNPDYHQRYLQAVQIIDELLATHPINNPSTQPT